MFHIQVFAALSNNTFVMENNLYYRFASKLQQQKNTSDYKTPLIHRLPEVLSPRLPGPLSSSSSHSPSSSPALSPSSSFLLAVVRHPFARLVSAYR